MRVDAPEAPTPEETAPEDPAESGPRTRRNPAPKGDPRFTGGQRMAAVGYKLLLLRQEAGFSQRDLLLATQRADPTGHGVSLATLSRLENNQHLPMPGTLGLLAKVFSDRLGRRITPLHLTGQHDSGRALTRYLERERKRRMLDADEFYGSLLGMSPAEADRLREGDYLPESATLGAIIRQIPDAASLVMAAMADAGVPPPASAAES